MGLNGRRVANGHSNSNDADVLVERTQTTLVPTSRLSRVMDVSTLLNHTPCTETRDESYFVGISKPTAFCLIKEKLKEEFAI